VRHALKLMRPHYDLGLLNTQWSGFYSMTIPFITAWPALLFGLETQLAPLFMPMTVCLGLGLFMLDMWRTPYCLVFFVFCLLLTIHWHPWLEHLTFGLTYGDGVSAVVLLFAVYALAPWRSQSYTKAGFLLVSFCCGLLALTKLPASGIFLCLLPLVIFARNGSISTRLQAAALFCLPAVVWLCACLLIIDVDVGVLSSWDGSTDVGTLKPIFEYLVGSPSSTFFCAFVVSAVSMLLFLFTARGWEWLLLFPVCGVLAFVLIGYATVFSNKEQLSTTRYLLHVLPTVYYLGGVGFERLFTIK
jgi:hypothetical protein